jgi:hypothetical protein
MNSTLVLGTAAIIFALFLRTQTSAFPEVAQRLPVLLIWIIVGLALLMFVEEFLQRRAARRASGDLASADNEPLAPINLRVVAAFGVAIVMYVILIPVVGYLVTTPLFMAGSLLVARTLSPSKSILIGIGATAFVWAVFVWALSLPVPILPFLK